MTNPRPSNQVTIAKAIATIAHRGQTDKAGNPYIGHPARVAAMLEASHPNSSETIAAGWLHDVLEDTEITAADLSDAGVNDTVIRCVEVVSRSEGEAVEDYYTRIRNSWTPAKTVKFADIADNSSVDRLALLDDATALRLMRKYAKARLLLGAQS